MDETTKVIIATLSGFIIAFFTEPVKSYFANKAKLHNLRLALYKELLSNYATVDTAIRHDVALTMFFYQPSLRTECYKHALGNEISLFYQLDEATSLNTLQGDIVRRLLDFSNYAKSLSHEEFKVKNFTLNEQFKSLAGAFITFFIIAVRDELFDNKLLKKISKNQYEDIMTLDPKARYGEQWHIGNGDE